MLVLLALVALLVGAAGLISIIIPLRFLGIDRRWKGFGLVIASLIALVVIGSRMDPQQSAYQQDSLTPRNTPPVTAAVVSVAPAISLPSEQSRFSQIIEDARYKYLSEQSEFRKGATRPERSRLLCSVKTGTEVTDWIGTVTTLSTNSYGKGVVAVQISPHIVIKTWNNTFSDIIDKTLIEPASSVFQQLGELQRNDRVKVSGRFLSNDTDCFREGSATMSGSMTDPEFLMHFRSIQKL